MRNALLAGAITALPFVLGHTGVVCTSWEIALYISAIPIGRHYWAKESLEKLFERRIIGIEI